MEAGLSGEERDLPGRRGWRGMIQRGAILFLLEKRVAVVGVSNLPIDPALRGQGLEDFTKTRNTPTVLRSMAAETDCGPAWGKEPKPESK